MAHDRGDRTKPVAAGAFTANARQVPLSDVEAAWTSPGDPSERIVLTPVH